MAQGPPSVQQGVASDRERERLRAVSPTWTSIAAGQATTVKAPHNTGGGSSGLQQLLSRPPPGTNTLVPTAGCVTKYFNSSFLAHAVLVLVVLDYQTVRVLCRGHTKIRSRVVSN